jgi:hypothetical protein
MCVLARCIEGVLHEVVEKEVADRDAKYAGMPLQTIEHIYAAIETNFEDPYQYSGETTVVVVDGVGKTTRLHKLTEDQAGEVNDTHALCRGSLLWEMIEGTGSRRSRPLSPRGSPAER